MSSRLRLIVACVLFSSWMILLLTGFVLHGALHLLLAFALALFPWRETFTAPKESPAADDPQEDCID